MDKRLVGERVDVTEGVPRGNEATRRRGDERRRIATDVDGDGEITDNIRNRSTDSGMVVVEGGGVRQTGSLSPHQLLLYHTLCSAHTMIKALYNLLVLLHRRMTPTTDSSGVRMRGGQLTYQGRALLT